MWVAHGMMRAMCQATKKEISVGGDGRGERIGGGKKREEIKESEREGEEREREGGEEGRFDGFIL